MHIIPLGYFNSFLPLKQFRFHCLLTPLQNVFAQSVLRTSLCNSCVLNLWWGNGSLKPEGWHLSGVGSRGWRAPGSGVGSLLVRAEPSSWCKSSWHPLQDCSWCRIAPSSRPQPFGCRAELRPNIAGPGAS